MDVNIQLAQLVQAATKLREEIGDLKVSLTKQNCKIVKLIEEQCNVAQKQDVLEAARHLPIRKAKINLFPIKSYEDLEAAEASITDENKREYISLAKALLLPGSFKKNLNKILSIDVIVDFNVDGTHSKRRFQDYPNLMDILYQATNKAGWTFKYFLDDLRLGFKSFKTRQFKVKYRQQKKYCLEPEIKIEQVLIPYNDE